MSKWYSFSGRIVPLEWGDSVYTVLPLPDDISGELAKEGARRVEIELNDHPLNLALTKAPVISQTFVYTGKSVLQQTGIAPGDEIEVRLRRADPNAVDVPSDIASAIRSADLSGEWGALTPGKKRGLLHQVSTAKRADTRARRIAQLIKTLTE